VVREHIFTQGGFLGVPGGIDLFQQLLGHLEPKAGHHQRRAQTKEKKLSTTRSRAATPDGDGSRRPATQVIS
jgi:hypothetical protein